MNAAEQETQDGSPALIDQEHIRVKFQLGPIKEVGVNGCQIEDLIEVLVNRLNGFQRGPFRCDENSIAIEHLAKAKAFLNFRTERRERRGVEGKNEA